MYNDVSTLLFIVYNFIFTTTLSSFLKLDNLERQTSRDAATISKMTSELRQFSSTQKENNSEISKLQKEVRILCAYLFYDTTKF